MARSNLTPGKPGPGRPPGSRNKTTVAAKEAIRLAAEGLGGTDRLIAWAREAPENERAFWTQLWGKLIPIDVDANVVGELNLVERRIVDSRY